MITLTKENFSQIFYRSTGITVFPNPFDFEGEEREIVKRRALWHLCLVYEDTTGQRLGIFTEDGDFTEAAIWLAGDELDKQILLLASELDEYIITEDGNNYISF